MSEFILMLTLNDMTVPNAMELYQELRQTGIKFFGFKDIGLPQAELKKLVEAMHADGHEVFLEVVSATAEDELTSARAAVAIGVDYLIGGTQIAGVKPIIAGTGMKYFPYVGQIVGHPCLLRGELNWLVEEAKKAEAMGIDGINLLAYRWDGDVNLLVDSIMEAVSIPLICAGSVDRISRVKDLAERGVWAFTIGGAVLQKVIVPGDMKDQVAATLEACKA